MKSTVIVTTVGGPWLGDQLAALAVQTRQPDQLVIVNNGPAGAVDDVVARWRPQLPGVELVEERSMSVCGHARNVGAAHARHPGLIFLDDDDTVNAGYVEAMTRALDETELVAASIDTTRHNTARLVSRWGDMQSAGPMTEHDFLPWVIGGAFGVRRETFEGIGGYDTDFLVAEDTDLCWRAQIDAGAKVGFTADATVFYRLRDQIRPAFRQARTWAFWDVALYQRYRSEGLPGPGNQLRALLRWGRPFLVAARARHSEDLVVAARLLGACLGRATGSLHYRCLYL